MDLDNKHSDNFTSLIYVNVSDQIVWPVSTIDDSDKLKLRILASSENH